MSEYVLSKSGQTQAGHKQRVPDSSVSDNASVPVCS
jgi:hypothetical protein